MGKGRVEAFSDGVFAVIITIMVLEMKVPHGADFAALVPIAPVFFSYVMSFAFIAIYWNNHHHVLHTAHKIDARVMWANMFLLFWISLIPFVTGWMGENHFPPVPVAAYGVVMLMSAIAYTILVRVLIAVHGQDSPLARAISSDNDFKGYASLALYVLAIGISFVEPIVSVVIYLTVSAMWFLPDRRIERQIKTK